MWQGVTEQDKAVSGVGYVSEGNYRVGERRAGILQCMEGCEGPEYVYIVLNDVWQGMA